MQNPKSFAVKLINVVADVMAGAGVAGLFAATAPASLTLAAGAIVVGLLGQAFVQSRGEAAAQKEGEALFKQQLDQHGSLKSVLRQIASEQDAGQIFAAEAARQMLAVIEAGRDATLESLGRQESLLTHVGEWLAQRCDEHNLSQEQLLSQLIETATRVEDKIDNLVELNAVDRSEHRQTSAQNVELHESTHQKLDEIRERMGAIRPSPTDAYAQIEKAVEHIKRRSFDIASYLLTDLRQRCWTNLTATERFRVLANLGHIAERKDGDYKKAASLYLEAFDADAAHENALALLAVAQMYLDNRDSARELADRAVAAAPNTALPHAIRVRLLPDGLPFGEAEQTVPQHLRSRPEVAFALAMRAMQRAAAAGGAPHRSELEAAERYAKAALDAEPGPLYRAHLGIIIMESERFRAINETVDATIKDPTRLRQAISLLTTSLEEYGKYPDPELHGRIHLVRGVAHALLRERSAAEKDFDAASVAAPDDPLVSFQKSIVLHDRHDPDGAITLLRQHLRDRVPSWSRLMLSKMLVRRNALGDRDEAISLLSAVLPAAAEAEPDVAVQTLDMLVQLLSDGGDHEGALSTIESGSAAAIDPAARAAISADLLAKAGKPDVAKQRIAEAVTLIAAQTSIDVKFRVASIAQDMGRHDLAFPLLKELIPDDRLIPELARLLAAAQALREDQFALEFCARLRGHGLFDWQAVLYEAQVLDTYNAASQAIAVLQEFLAVVPADLNAKLARVVLCEIAIRAGRDDLAITDADLLPSVNQVTAEWGERTVHVLRTVDSAAAFDYAYRLVRRFFSRPEAHRAIIAFLASAGDQLQLVSPTRVTDDCAVRYRERGKTEDEWWIIETEPEPDVARRELSPCHLIAQAMRGKRPDAGADSEFFIDINGIQDRVGDVVEILDKRLYRLRNSANNFRERFPEEPFVVLMVQAVKPDGTPDVGPILRYMEQRERVLREAEAQWRKGRWPIASLASVLGVPTARIIEHLITRMNIRQWCCLGGLGELSSATLSLQNTKALVLDPTALSSLFLSGTFRSIKSGSLLFIASAGAVAEFRRLRDDMRRGAPAVELDTFVQWLRDCVRVEDGLAMARMPESRRRSMLDTVGRPTAESLVLMEYPGHVLWSDDVWLAIWANKERMSIRTAWSQVAVKELVKRGQADYAAEDQLAVWLIRSRFFFLRISPEAVVRAAQQSAWNTNADPFYTMIRIFGVQETDSAGLYHFTVATFIRVLEAMHDRAIAAEAIEAILDRVNSIEGGLPLIQALLSGRTSALWPSAQVQLTAKLAIERWFTLRQWASRM